MKSPLTLAFAAVASLLLCDAAMAVSVVPPLPTANLVGRYQASSFAGSFSNGQTINTAWMDTGGSNDAAVTGTPTFSTALGFPTVRFTQADSEGFTASGPPGIAPTSGFAYFGVLRSDATTAGGGGVANGNQPYFWDRDPSVDSDPLASLKGDGTNYGFQKRDDAGAGLGGPISTTDVSTTDLQIVAIRRNTTDSQFEIWVDGVLEDTAADPGTNLTPQPILIGNGGGFNRGFTGDIADLLIFDSELSDEDFNAVGSNLELLFGLDTAFPDAQIVPEPSTIAIWSLLSLVACGYFMRRRRRPN